MSPMTSATRPSTLPPVCAPCSQHGRGAGSTPSKPRMRNAPQRVGNPLRRSFSRSQMPWLHSTGSGLSAAARQAVTIDDRPPNSRRASCSLRQRASAIGFRCRTARYIDAVTDNLILDHAAGEAGRGGLGGQRAGAREHFPAAVFCREPQPAANPCAAGVFSGSADAGRLAALQGSELPGRRHFV